MRILLDEDLNIRLRRAFSDDHEVETVAYRGWKGVDNGELLRRAAECFDVLVTMDDNLPHQQDLPAYEIAVVVLRARSKALSSLAELVPEVERILSSLAPGEARRVHPPE